MTQAIHDTQEYKISSGPDKHWAFVNKPKYINSQDAAKLAGVDIGNLSVKVKANTGDEVDAPVEVGQWSIMPKSKSVKYKTDDGKTINVFMIKGASPKNKSAIYFTEEDYKNSKELLEYKSKIDKAFKDYWRAHRDGTVETLKKKMSPAAKKALKELPNVIKSGTYEDVYQWFKDAGFDMPHLKAEDFKNFVKDYKRTGHIDSSWLLASESRWGHEQGSSAQIDFAKKKIGTLGWSSDD